MPFRNITLNISPADAVRAVGETLRRIDGRLIDHGERVAFIACELNRLGNLGMDVKTLFLLSLFHDIGAYKTDEIDRMVEFETHDVWNHSIYGYLFLKYLTPLSTYAEAILYHHSSMNDLTAAGINFANYASMIHLADRTDIAMSCSSRDEMLSSIFANVNGTFNPEYVKLLKTAHSEGGMFSALTDSSYKSANIKMFENTVHISSEEAFKYLQMVIFSIDFRSVHTVTHTINTVSIAINIAEHFGLSEEEKEKIYIGALLHDAGKIAIPIEILEYPGRLTDEQMAIMKTHVDETEKLIRGVVPEDICLISLRHHEKLDGSGYPRGLTADVLTFPQRIVAVADIVSALSSSRSYKESFPRDKTISILRSMEEKQLDKSICDYICSEYDEIIRKTDIPRARIIEIYKKLTEEFDALRSKLDR